MVSFRLLGQVWFGRSGLVWLSYMALVNIALFSSEVGFGTLNIGQP